MILQSSARCIFKNESLLAGTDCANVVFLCRARAERIQNYSTKHGQHVCCFLEVSHVSCVHFRQVSLCPGSAIIMVKKIATPLDLSQFCTEGVAKRPGCASGI